MCQGDQRGLNSRVLRLTKDTIARGPPDDIQHRRDGGWVLQNGDDARVQVVHGQLQQWLARLGRLAGSGGLDGGEAVSSDADRRAR